jgi:hypothetical protein
VHGLQAGPEQPAGLLPGQRTAAVS